MYVCMQVFTDWGIPPERERPGLVACAADVRAALEREKEGKKREQDPAVQLLDARAAAQFTGNSVAVMVVMMLSLLVLAIYGIQVLFLEFQRAKCCCFHAPSLSKPLADFWGFLQSSCLRGFGLERQQRVHHIQLLS